MLISTFDMEEWTLVSNTEVHHTDISDVQEINTLYVYFLP